MAEAAESSNGVKCNDAVVQLACQAGTPSAFHQLLRNLL